MLEFTPLFDVEFRARSIVQDTRAFDTSFTRFISNPPQSIPRLWKQLLDKIGGRTEAVRFVVRPPQRHLIVVIATIRCLLCLI
ncbi:hypothetical protein BU200_01735 [Streptococcus acidominimus]|uniref:Uncharacterized protein n=1 Tax=Streptococcus acidominimus TaxID=1326 RepID=A0A1Q8EF95_STRAI|nr:hypothetical protein BU200_01735 [Streptococcus acidominimus]